MGCAVQLNHADQHITYGVHDRLDLTTSRISSLKCAVWSVASYSAANLRSRKCLPSIEVRQKRATCRRKHIWQTGASPAAKLSLQQALWFCKSVKLLFKVSKSMSTARYIKYFSCLSLLNAAVCLAFLVHKGPRMRLGSCCRERKTAVQRSNFEVSS